MTADEIAGITVFAELPARDRERLARAAADISLRAGEYAVHEGGEGALFAVLEGRIEPIKLVDGIERVVGARAAGGHLRRGAADAGDRVPRRVPCGRAVPRAANRAAGLPRRRSRRARVAKEVGRLAGHRIGGPAACRGSPPTRRRGARSSSAIAGIRRPPSCGASSTGTRSRSGGSHPMRPTRTSSGGGGRCRPTRTARRSASSTGRPCSTDLRRAAELLGLTTEPSSAEYDVVIVGAGPAGLAAAVYGASEGLHTIAIEREAPGGQAGTSSQIENYLGFPGGVSGDELASRALQQAQRLGAEILVTRSITRIDPATKQVYLDGGDVLRGRTIIVACGVAWRKLAIEGFERLAGKGISYGAARARRRAHTAWTSTSWGRATRPGRRRSTSPTTRRA